MLDFKRESWPGTWGLPFFWGMGNCSDFLEHFQSRLRVGPLSRCCTKAEIVTDDWE